MTADTLSSKMWSVQKFEKIDWKKRTKIAFASDIKEFLKEEAKLFDLMATENISMDDFWHRRNKLLGKDLI